MKKYLLSLPLLFALMVALLPSRAVFASTADDEFNSGSMDGKWAWTRENVGSWSLTGTALQMTTLNEDMYNNTQTAPLLLQDLVDDFSTNNKYNIVTKLTMSPTANYHQAGIVLWQDDNNFIQLNLQYVSGTVEVELYREISNVGIAWYKTIADPGAIWLKLERYENVYTGWYSLDGAAWEIVGQYRGVTLGPTQFGLTAYHASATTGIVAEFDFFHADLIDPVLDAPAAFQGWWKCSVAQGQTCPTGAMGGLEPYSYEGLYTSTATAYMNEVKLLCRYNTCTQQFDVQYSFDFTVSWTGNNSATARLFNGIMTIQGQTDHYPYDHNINCGSGTAGTCTSMDGGVVSKSLVNADYTQSMHFRFEIHNMQGQINTISKAYIFTLGFASLFEQTCTDTYLILSEGEAFPITPTTEFPITTDEEYQEVVTGVVYRITTTDGPWDDGVNLRYDAAVSWDGVTYTKLQDLENILCIDYDQTNPALVSVYIEAPTDDFYIRVNDTAGAFADNDVVITEFHYALSVAVQVGPTGCEEYSYDPEADLIAEGTIDATLEDGIDSGGEFAPYSYYMIETTDGPWLDAGTGGDRYDAQASWTGSDFEGGQSFTIGAEGDTFGVGCTEDAQDGIHSRVYFQAPGTQFGPAILAMQVRVNDTGGVFSDNTGDLGYKIYAVDYDHSEELCETQYIIGDVITSGEIRANAETGKYIGAWYGDPLGYHVPSPNMEPGGAYMIETSGGPWNFLGVGHSNVSSYAVSLSGETSLLTSGWDTPETWDFADCVVEVDALGHQRIYFTAAPAVTMDIADDYFETFARVGDTSDFGTNNGSLRFTLYGVIDQKQEDENCQSFTYEEVEPPLSGVIVQGDDEDGSYISNVNMIDPELTFAIVVDEGAWQEYSGGEDLYSMQISDDRGSTWQELSQADFRHCYDDEGAGRLVLYVPGGAYDMRVNSNTFPGNTGYRHVSVYSVGNENDCFGQYDPYPIDPFEWIPEDREEGIVITGQEGLPTTNLVVGQTYILQIEDGPWTTPEAQSYDAAMSSDGGTTWQSMEGHPDIICFGTDYLGFHDKVAFTVATEQQWKIRVDDSAGQFDDNGGSLAYSLYTTLGDVVDPNDAWDAYVQDCSNACLRPTSIDVAEWIDYAGCRVQQYFAWCPDNTDTLVSFLDTLETVEPMGTVSEVQTLIDTTQAEIDSYDWSGSEYGEEGVLGGSSADMETLIPTLPSNSPWNGGPVVTWSWGNSSNLYSTSCEIALTDYIGPYAGGGVCWVSNIADESSLLYWVQIIIDLSAIFMLVRYLLAMVFDMSAWLGLNSGSS